MASKNRNQRIGIWIIAIVMLVGTIGSFLVIILANSNQTIDQEQAAKQQADIAAQVKEYQDKTAAQATELSAKYFTQFNAYATLPAVFDKASVTKLTSEDLKVGNGDSLTDKSTFTAYYIGWGPDGVVFDGSIENGALKAPFSASPGGVIAGWTEGVSGMKVGGVRVLTIPADKAYGEQGSGTIAANTPLKFVLFVIPTPPAIPVSDELIKAYQQ